MATSVLYFSRIVSRGAPPVHATVCAAHSGWREYSETSKPIQEQEIYLNSDTLNCVGIANPIGDYFVLSQSVVLRFPKAVSKHLVPVNPSVIKWFSVTPSQVVSWLEPRVETSPNHSNRTLQRRLYQKFRTEPLSDQTVYRVRIAKGAIESCAVVEINRADQFDPDYLGDTVKIPDRVHSDGIIASHGLWTCERVGQVLMKAVEPRSSYYYTETFCV